MQPGDDLLDVHVRRVVAEVDQALGLGPQLLRGEDRAAPVGDHGGIERRLEHLVLQQHPPVVGQGVIDLGGRLQIAVEAAGEVLLAGEVGPVADPDGEVPGAELPTDLDAFDVVLDRLGAGRRHGRGERAGGVGLGLAGLVLEGVGVHRVEAEAERGGLLAQGGVVAHLVPGKVRRDARGDAAQLLDDGAVLQLLVDVGRLAGDRELGEARAAAPRAPGRHGDREAGHPVLDRIDGDALALELAA